MMAESCIFCKIASGEIPAQVLYEDEMCVAFYDRTPAAAVHVLVIPKEHIRNVAELGAHHEALIGHIFRVIADVAKTLPLTGGYRVVTNSDGDAAQSVFHLHFHVIGGEPLSPSMC